mgnify:CR=1 FL=1
MNNNMMNKEVREAIQAGERALNSLREAKSNLDSARNWGIFDMLGGGFITDVIKHSKMENASSCMENAKYDLHIFQRELKDVYISLDMKVDVGGFLSFADFFFDGFVADYLVQTRIGEARRQVNEAIDQVERILAELRRY